MKAFGCQILRCCKGFVLLLGIITSTVALNLAQEPSIDWDREQQFWSFKPPQKHSPPSVQLQSWPRQPLDHFILARLEHAGLVPSAQADKRTLIRRLTFDLTGLPPTPEEVIAFLRDRSPDTYESLVDRLLASPRFGERMASIWLPLARYAEDQAHQVGDDTKYFYPNAFKYREWVIKSFNDDLTYDRFLKYQLAADKLDAEADHLAALGFLGLGPKYYNRNRIEVMADEWEDRVDTVSRTMLGLTVACARCHDHKLEPITMRDYYAMAGVFASTRMVNRTPSGLAPKEDASAKEMDPSTLHIVEDGEPKDLHIFLRGNPERKGELAPRQFLQLLSGDSPEEFEFGSGREQLAQSIASPKNPLTARVFVNRVWGTIFGQPLVATPSNFGHSGQTPTHPKLLDDLSVRFMENGWSVKSLVREMVLSATYRQHSSAPKPLVIVLGREDTRAGDRLQKDPENELLSRMNRKRLSIEQWRDSVLFTTGQLEWGGGQSLELDDPANNRRTVFARISRLKLNDMLTQFDYPDANVHAEDRAETTTATQKLFLLNSPFILRMSQALATRIEKSSEHDSGRIQLAYHLLYGRDPTSLEKKLALDFLSASDDHGCSRLERYVQILLASNEVMYVD